LLESFKEASLNPKKQSIHSKLQAPRPLRQAVRGVAAMTAARLSPTAQLLRNSKLFALPAPIPLPTANRYTDLPSSETATTIHPTRAALETPKTSLKIGDWGLKRALPIRTTTKSGTPTFRIRGGIDTPEHIADFESAADHVINLKKFQELDLRITLPDDKGRGRRDNESPFAPTLDNTTEKALPDIAQQDGPNSWLTADRAQRAAKLPNHLKATLEQYEAEKRAETDLQSDSVANSIFDDEESMRFGADVVDAPNLNDSTKRRWRYTGPYLAGITEFEFDNFLNKITPEKKAAFRGLVKQHLIDRRLSDSRSRALDEGLTEELTQESSAEPTEEEVTTHLRNLRSEHGEFGPLIASFFDLADGPQQEINGASDPWRYGRDTITAHRYKQTGPPRTHPSAGLSYQYSGRFILNDVRDGPLASRRPAAARVLQSSAQTETLNKPHLGVAGFVVSNPARMEVGNIKWEPMPGGPKCVVQPEAAIVTQSGKLDIQAAVKNNWQLKNNIPRADSDARQTQEQLSAAARSRSLRTPALGRTQGRRVKIDVNLVEEFDQLNASTSPSYNPGRRV